MATSSITKQFVVKDPKAFERLIKESTKPIDIKPAQRTLSLDRGREALRQFTIR